MCPEAEPSRRSEARMVHGRPDSSPSTETGLAFRTDRPRAEDPGRSRRSELSGSGSAHSGQARGDRLITNSPCRCAMSPGRRSVQPDHRRTPKAAVPWGGSFCFPLMALRAAPS